MSIGSCYSKHSRVFITPQKLRNTRVQYLSKFYLVNGGTISYSVKLTNGFPGDDTQLKFKVIAIEDKKRNALVSDACEDYLSSSFSQSNMTLYMSGKEFE